MNNIKALNDLQVFVKEYNNQPKDKRISYKYVVEKVKDVKLSNDSEEEFIARVVPQWDLSGDSHQWLLKFGKKFRILHKLDFLLKVPLKIVVIDYDMFEMRSATMSLKYFLRDMQNSISKS